VGVFALFVLRWVKKPQANDFSALGEKLEQEPRSALALECD
jgi:hypothetical protein